MALLDEALLAEWERAHSDITSGLNSPARVDITPCTRTGCGEKSQVRDTSSGFGVDSITFAQHGALMAFVDLVETNLKVLERLCKVIGLKDVYFVLLKNLDSLKPVDTYYDVIMAMDSLHQVPVDVMKPEYQELSRH